jgi:hypothetical protein
MAERARDMVSSPAGSALLCELVGVDVLGTIGVPGDVQRWLAELDERLVAAVADWSLPELSPRSLLAELYEVVEGLAFGCFSEWHHLATLPAEVWDPLLPVAQSLISSAAASWWWDPRGSEQFWVRGADAPAPAADGQLPTWSDVLPDHDDVWWVQPPVGPPTSRQPPGDALPVAAVCPDWHEKRGPRVEIWSVRAVPDARVFEVRGPDDWIELVRAHPRRVAADHAEWRQWTGWTGDWIVVDWSAVARDWAGVHVTVGGWVTAAHRLLPVPGGATVLAGWNPDETVWLRDPPVAVGKIAEADLPPGA